MRIPEHPTQIRAMLGARRARLASDKPALAGTLKVQGRSKNVYVPFDLLDDVRSWIAEHKRLKALQAEIHQLTVALIRTHTTHKRQKAGRR
jgi:hypothetical protein